MTTSASTTVQRSQEPLTGVALSRTLGGVLEGFLRHSIDYAGLFPPAGLSMEEAVTNYARYLSGSEAWILGRFVLPLTRIAEMERVAYLLLPAASEGKPWELSVLLNPGSATEAARVEDFNERYCGRMKVSSSEVRYQNIGSCDSTLKNLIDSLPPKTEVWVEVDLEEDIERQVGSIAESGAFAKIRTGGVVPELIPSPKTVMSFLVACIRSRVRFKATAGLHHALRGDFPLTYESGSQTATLFGYLNLFLATAVAKQGGTVEEIASALEEWNPTCLESHSDRFAWRSFAWTRRDTELLRRETLASFGSCSVVEPLDELMALNNEWKS